MAYFWAAEFVAVITTRPLAFNASRKGKLASVVLTTTSRAGTAASIWLQSDAVRSGPTRLNLATSPSNVPWPSSTTSRQVILRRGLPELAEGGLDVGRRASGPSLHGFVGQHADVLRVEPVTIDQRRLHCGPPLLHLRRVLLTPRRAGHDQRETRLRPRLAGGRHEDEQREQANPRTHHRRNLPSPQARPERRRTSHSAASSPMIATRVQALCHRSFISVARSCSSPFRRPRSSAVSSGRR